MAFNFFNHDEQEFKKTIAKVYLDIKQNKKISYDTNVYIIIAKHQSHHNEELILDQIAKSDNHFLTTGTQIELEGLVHGNKFDNKITKILRHFLNHCKIRPIPNRSKFKMMKDNLLKYIVILPREIAYESVGHIYVEILNKVIRGEIDKVKAFKQLTNKVEIYEKAKKLVQYKYLFFKRQLKVNLNKYESNYMRECLRFIEIAINDLKHEYAHQISMEQIIENIERKLKKSYDKDCQYVIETLMHGIIPHSNDSDVIWLKNILFSKEQKAA